MIDSVEEIKGKLNVADLVGEYVKLMRAGNNLRGLCPFHREKTPSFFVSPERNMWHCFGCGKSGDIFTFLQNIENIDFAEALKILARRTGVQLVRTDQKAISQKTKLIDLCELSGQFYHQVLLQSSLAEAGRKYLLKEREIREDIVEDFRLGYAPAAWDSLLKFLLKKNYKESEIESAGLIVKSERGTYYDRFRNRIIFPIFNVYGQTIGFTARILPSGDTQVQKDGIKEAKYVNTPETPIFNKRRILYGLDKAKSSIREKDQVVLVEGQMDVISCHQAGAKNVICSSGTALTEDQVSLLGRYTKNVILGFDLDLAGIEATKRGISLLLQNDFDVKVLMLPSGKDPDEYLKKNSNNWDKIVSEALPIMEYYLRSALASVKSSLEEVADLNIGDKKKIIQSILPNIAQLANLVEQDLWIKKISDLLKIGEESVRGEFVKMKKPVSEARAGEEEKPEHQDATGQEGAMGDALLGLIFTLQDGVQKYFADIDPELFWVEDQKKIVNLIKKCYAVKEEKVVIDQPLWDKLLTIELKKYIDHLIFIAEIEFKTDKTKELEKYIDKMFIFLKRKYLGRKLVKIEQDLAQAEGAKDQDRVKKLTSLASELSKQITKLKII